MTVQIDRKQIGDVDFPALVAAHCAELQAWVTKVDVPPPAAHFLVEAAVKRVPRAGLPDEFVPDFEIIEPPAPSADELKQAAIAASKAQEAQDIAAIMPNGKLRLLQIEATEAAKVKASERSAEQRAALSAMGSYMAARLEVEKRAAKREADIDDQFPG